MNTVFACILSTRKLPTSDLFGVMGAAQLQLAEDYAPAWERKPATVTLWSSSTPIPKVTSDERVVPAYFRDAAPGDDEDALAYHWVNPETKLVEVVVLVDRILSEPGAGIDDVSIAATHEFLETLGDEFADQWVDVGDGTEQPQELCDRVQGYSYYKTVKDSIGQTRAIKVTDFLLPDAFNYDAPDDAKFDFLGKLSGAFVVGDGGYTGSRPVGGGETTVLGDKKAALAYSHKTMERRGIDLNTLRR